MTQIASLAAYRSAVKQQILVHKNLIGSTIASMNRYWDTGGSTGTGSINPGNTANGVVPTNATTGAVPITNFSGSGYLTNVEVALNSPVAAAMPIRMFMFDLLFSAGQYTANQSQTLTSQPSYASRIPNGDYSGTEIWIEPSAGHAAGAVPSLTITYTNQSGASGQVATASWLTGLNGALGMMQASLAPGDTGVQMIESVVSVGGSGSTNVIVVRPLWRGFFPDISSYERVDWIDRTKMPEIYPTSCISFGAFCTSGNNCPSFDINFEIASA